LCFRPAPLGARKTSRRRAARSRTGTVAVRRLEIAGDAALSASLAMNESVSGLFARDEPLCLVSRSELQRLEQAQVRAEHAQVRWWAFIASHGELLERRARVFITDAEAQLAMPLSLPVAEVSNEGDLTLTWQHEGRYLRVLFLKGKLSWVFGDGGDAHPSFSAIFFTYLKILGKLR
jgi:hypothetical protein